MDEKISVKLQPLKVLVVCGTPKFSNMVDEKNGIPEFKEIEENINAVKERFFNKLIDVDYYYVNPDKVPDEELTISRDHYFNGVFEDEKLIDDKFKNSFQIFLFQNCPIYNPSTNDISIFKDWKFMNQLLKYGDKENCIIAIPIEGRVGLYDGRGLRIDTVFDAYFGERTKLLQKDKNGINIIKKGNNNYIPNIKIQRIDTEAEFQVFTKPVYLACWKFPKILQKQTGGSVLKYLYIKNKYLKEKNEIK
jgi:hypothetical protein